MKFSNSILILLVFSQILYGMEQNKKRTFLFPIEKLSLLDSMRKGTLKIHHGFYECPSFVENPLNQEVTYFIDRSLANLFLEEEFLQRSPRDCKQLFDTPIFHQFLTNDNCSLEKMENCVRSWIQDLMESKFGTELGHYMGAIVDNDIEKREKYSKFLKNKYELYCEKNT